ncbi:hypothetical protein PRK78_006167 [Emydomyces testavorans]|uniref:Uncharacterized protein n=1 Tax=Emydomyces testavorans TaxID=2070801 RepID=A0AAF0DPS0_9EURO|nr:hypothetical protein PRK78_006167 [Emydomyces testavorans]
MMLSAESERKRMGIYLEDWNCPATDNLVPPPLRPRAVSTTTTPSVHSPPLSPNPTVFVSLQFVEPGTTASGNLSLQQYRRSLSRSRPDLTTASLPARSLKRKPKALNLNTNCAPRTLPSPPLTPPSPSVSSEYSSLSIPQAQPAREPQQSTWADNRFPEFLATPVTPTATKSIPGVNTFPEQRHPGPGSDLIATRRDSHTSRLVNKSRQSVFCKHIRQIPAKLFSHNKPASEIAPSSTRLKRTLHHRGVSFEILSPQRRQYSHSCSSLANIQPELIGCESMAFSHQPWAQSRVRSHSADGERYRTPSRALFDDLETAHSSITSRLNPDRNGISTSSPDLQRDGSPIQEKNHAQEAEVAQSLGAAPLQHSMALSLPVNHDPLTDLIPDGEESQLHETNDALKIQDPLFAISQRSGATAAQANADFESHRCALARHISTRWSFNATGRRDRQRKRTRLVKRRPVSHTDPIQRTISTHISPRNSASSVLSSFLDKRQPNLNGIRGRIDKPKTIDNIMKNRRSMLSMGLRNTCRPDLQDGGESQVDTQQCLAENEGFGIETVDGGSDSKTQMHQRAYATEEVVGSPHLDSLTPSNNTHLDTRELVPPNLYRQKTGASSPNFSRPIPTRKWLASRLSSFRSSTRSSAKVLHDNSTLDSVRSPTQIQSDQEVQRENERSIVKLLSRQSASIAREIERGLSQARTYGSDSQLDDEEVIDVGPGSSQSSSTQHLSQHTGSSRIFPSPLRLSSGPSSQFSEQRPGNPYFHGGLRPPPLPKRSESRGNTHATLNKHAELLGVEGVEEEEDADHDWETVAGSQQFKSGLVRQADTEGSLADYSSFGSLENPKMQSRRPLRSSRVFLPNASPNTDTVETPAFAGRYSHYFHKDPSTGQYVLLPNTYYRHSEGARLNAFSKPAPALLASTSRSPTPLPNRYQHPTPLSDAHTNPFRSTPPSLHGQPGQGDEPAHSSSCSPTVGNSKSSSYDSKANKHTSRRGYGQLQPNINILQNTRTSFQHWFSEIIAKDPAQNSSQSSSAPQDFSRNSEGTRLHPCPDTNITATGTDDNSSTNPLSLNLDCHPCFRPYQPVSQLPNHVELTRENSNVPSRSLSTDRLLPPAPVGGKHAPGSLYLSIRSARDRVLKNGYKRKSLNHLISNTIQESPSEDVTPRAASTGLLERHLQRQGTVRSSIFASRSTHPQTPTVTRQSSTRQGTKRLKPDEILRDRLEQMDPALLADFCQPSPHSRLLRTTREARLSPLDGTPNATHAQPPTGGRLSPIGFAEESAIPPEMSFDHHSFSEPPRLNPTRRRSTRINLVKQRRLGRQLILWGSLAGPLGWIALALIGFGGGVADVLIQWRSDGSVDEFHEKEELLARRLSVAYASALFVMAMVVMIVILAL